MQPHPPRLRVLAAAALCAALALAPATACGPSSGDANDNNTSGNSNGNDNDNVNTNANTNVPPGCGNGTLEAPEECDDGAANSNSEPDACRLDCRRARCGDLVRDSNEGCDGPDFGGSTCADFGGADGTLGCGSDCSVDSSGCFTCGDGTCEPAETFNNCPADCGIVDVAAGAEHTCVLLGDGSAMCWGANTHDQLGNGLGVDSDNPVWVQGLDSAVAIAAGGSHTCAARSDGSVWCWGDNAVGQLGNGTIVDSPSPTPANVSGTAVAVSAGTTHTCALLASGTVVCWGQNTYGQCGNGASGTTEYNPVPVGTISNVTQLSAGGRHTCALASGGLGWCWGYNSAGRLGDGTTNDAASPVSVSGAGPLTTISAGQNHTCAVRSTGALLCWGGNADGQLGDGTTNNTSAVPVDVLSLTGAVDVSAAFDHSCAVLGDGSAWCWGQGDLGQLGNGGFASSAVPVMVSGSSGYERIHGLRDHHCVVWGDTQLRCWGGGSRGQLGNSATDNSAVPVTVTGF